MSFSSGTPPTKSELVASELAANEKTPRRAVNRSTLGALALLVGIFLVARYVVGHFRRAGSMSVIEAQAMDMSVMKPPVGTVPVSFVTVRRGNFSARLTLSGSVVPFNDQEVAARVTGRVLDLPVYTGDRVHRGQLLVRLDSAELGAKEEQARLAAAAAREQRAIAATEIQQAQANRLQSQAEIQRASGGVQDTLAALAGSRDAVRQAALSVSSARSGVLDALAALDSAQRGVVGARADVMAAQRDRKMREGELDDARSALDDARGEVQNVQAQSQSVGAKLPQAASNVEAARADADFQSAKLARSQALLKQGAVSKEEFQQDQAAARNAQAKLNQMLAAVDAARSDIAAQAAQVRQAQARVRGAQARIRVAQDNLARSDANIQSASAKVAQMAAEVERAQSHVAQSQAAVGVAQEQLNQSGQNVRSASAKVDQARAGVNTADAMAQGSDAALSKAQMGTTQAQIAAQQAGAALSEASIVRGYTEIRATDDGIVTQRLVAPGVLVNSGAVILKIAQVSKVRFQANIAASDLAHIQLGQNVKVRSLDGNRVLDTRVSAVFPTSDAASRTGIVEAVAPNADNRFKPGEAITMDIATSQSSGAFEVPNDAIVMQQSSSSDVIPTSQNATLWTMQPAQAAKPIYTCTMHPQIREEKPGDCPICGMKLTPLSTGGQWRARLISVQIGGTDGNSTQVVGGLSDDTHVITQGFENLKNGDAVNPISDSASQNSGDATDQTASTKTANTSSSTRTSTAPTTLQNLNAQPAKVQNPKVQTARIVVSDTGYQPPTLSLKKGVPAQITFLRTSSTTCGTEVLFPALKIDQKLPLNQPVVINLTPQKTGAILFQCGMGMLHGKVIVNDGGATASAVKP